MPCYRKPDGTYTENVDEYIDAWDELKKPICEALGWEAHGMNPGIGFLTYGDNGDYQGYVTLGVEQAEKLKRVCEVYLADKKLYNVNDEKNRNHRNKKT